jgi:uncharacterized membrane protein
VTDRQRDKSFDRIAIIVLSVEWVVFGSMHFSMIDDTVRQIPFSFELEIKHHLAIISGIAEVATGILILVPEFRRWAAWSTVGLLILLFPAMYNILSEPSVAGSGALATVFRIALMPNNIFMAICAVHLLRHRDASLARPEAIAAAPRAHAERIAFKPMRAILAALLLMANCAGFLALSVGVPGSFGLASLWAMGCIASGALIGFLFGVPRANPAARLSGQFLPNTNVEAVSDWLTKIVVGVSLVNLRSIGTFIDSLAVDLGPALGTPKAFATGLIVYFFAVGIIQGYILTRVFLTEQFKIDKKS